VPLRFHPDVGVSREHGARDVPSDAHNHFVDSSPTRGSATTPGHPSVWSPT
jgi:hypothetical protein